MAESDQSTAQRLRGAFELLVRTMKTRSLYEARNPVSEKLEVELHGRLSALLDEQGSIELKVSQYSILFGDEVVYENQERKESLAFLFSRDGIRGLALQPGLTLEETSSLVSCLNRARVLVGGEDDLATLFWERDFASIEYFVVDELTEGSDQGLVESLVGTGWPGSSSAAAETSKASAAGRPVDLEDLRQSARLPVGSAQLSKAELEALHGELAQESTADLPVMAVRLAVELVMLEPSEDERRILATALAGIFDDLSVHDRGEDFLRAFAELRELALERFGAERSLAELFDVVRHALAREGPLARLLAALDGRPELAERAAGFLSELPASAVPALLARLGALEHSGIRRAVSDALLAHGGAGPSQLMDRLPALVGNQESRLLDELLHMVRHLPADQACPMVAQLLRAGDPELAHRAALILGHFKGHEAESLLFDLFERGEPRLRSLALGALARCGNRALAARLLDKALETGTPELDEEERRRVVAAAARLGGDSILPALDELLEARAGVWFPTREEKELLVALVHGLRAAGTRAARKRLRALAEGSNRMLRSMARKELAAGQGR